VKKERQTHAHKHTYQNQNQKIHGRTSAGAHSHAHTQTDVHNPLAPDLLQLPPTIVSESKARHCSFSLFVPTALCCQGSVFSEFHFLGVLCSRRSVFLELCVLGALWSKSSVFSELYFPGALCSQSCMFQELYVPGTQCCRGFAVWSTHSCRESPGTKVYVRLFSYIYCSSTDAFQMSKAYPW